LVETDPHFDPVKQIHIRIGSIAEKNDGVKGKYHLEDFVECLAQASARFLTG